MEVGDPIEGNLPSQLGSNFVMFTSQGGVSRVAAVGFVLDQIC